MVANKACLIQIMVTGINTKRSGESNVMNDYIEYDPRFGGLLKPGAKLERLATGAIWSEGPVYFHEDESVIWSDIPNNRLLRWSAIDGMKVWRQPSNFENGHYRDQEGRLLSCEHGGRCISRTEPDGSKSILVDRYQGKKLNSPNDLVVKSDGTIWFTDPQYGIASNYEGYKADSELGDNYVFRFDPVTQELTILTDTIVDPNGLAFSPDEKILYVADTFSGLDPKVDFHITAFAVVDGRRIENGRGFARINPGMADGFRVDKLGNIFTSSEDSIQVFASDGTLIGKIFVPEKVGNVMFGGPEKNRLFIAASSSLYAIDVNTTGLQ
jgi:gluconolactonase